MKSDNSNIKDFTLDLDYIPPSKWLEGYKEKSENLQVRFEKFEDWVGKKFDRKLSTYIYGGNITGCIAYSFLKTIKPLSVEGIIDKNPPMPYLQNLHHILPEKCSEKIGLLFVAVCPTHYNIIKSTFIDNLNSKPVTCYMFKKNPIFLGQEKDISGTNGKLSEQCFNETKLTTSGIVMIGDSLTYGLNCNKFLNGVEVDNKGSDGNMAMGILSQLDSILEVGPHTICIMIGINDLLQGSLSMDVFRTYNIIVDKIVQKGIKPIIQSTLFISDFYPSVIDTKIINNEVGCLNSLIRTMCESRSLTFVDLNRIIAPKGHLASELTSDGLHLNSDGYQVWSKAILPLLP